MQYLNYLNEEERKALTNNLDMIKTHLLEQNRDVWLNRVELGDWLKHNWQNRYTTRLYLKNNKEEDEFLIKEIQYKPLTNNLHDSLCHLTLADLGRRESVKTKIPIVYKNRKSLKFGIFVEVIKQIPAELSSDFTLNSIEIDLPKHISLDRRELRIRDLNLSDLNEKGLLKFLMEDSALLCKSLKSSQEKRQINQSLVKKRK